MAAGFSLQGLVFAAIVTQAPRIKDKFDIGDGGLTGILVLVAVVSGVGSVIAGIVAERRTSAAAFRLALLTIGLGALLVGVAPTLPLVVAAFVVYGLGVGAVDAGMNMQGVRVQHAYGRSIMANFHGMWSIAGIAGALFAAGAAEIDLPLALSLIIIAVATWTTVAFAAPHFIAAKEHDPGLSAKGLELPWRPILVFGLVILLFYAADTGILTWSSVYLEDALDSTTSVAPLAYGAYEAGALISRFGGDFLVRRVGATKVVAVGTTVGVAGLVVVVSAASPAMAIGGFFVTGLGLAILAPLSFAALAGAVPATVARRRDRPDEHRELPRRDPRRWADRGGGVGGPPAVGVRHPAGADPGGAAVRPVVPERGCVGDRRGVGLPHSSLSAHGVSIS